MSFEFIDSWKLSVLAQTSSRAENTCIVAHFHLVKQIVTMVSGEHSTGWNKVALSVPTQYNYSAEKTSTQPINCSFAKALASS